MISEDSNTNEHLRRPGCDASLKHLQRGSLTGRMGLQDSKSTKIQSSRIQSSVKAHE